MASVLSGSELSKASKLFASYFDEDTRISTELLKKPGMSVALLDSGFSLYYGVPECVQRYQNALCALECEVLLATPYSVLMKSPAQFHGSKLLRETAFECSSPVVVAIQNNLSEIQSAFQDVVIAQDVVITDSDSSFILFDDLAGEHAVIVGPESFVEAFLGMSVEDAWEDWALDIASYGFKEGSRGMNYVTGLTNHYRQF